MAQPQKPATRKQVFLYSLLMLGGAGVFAHKGVYSWRVGHDIATGHTSYGPADSFFWALFCLVVSAVLFAVAMGWMKGGPGALR